MGSLSKCAVHLLALLQFCIAVSAASAGESAAHHSSRPSSSSSSATSYAAAKNGGGAVLLPFDPSPQHDCRYISKDDGRHPPPPGELACRVRFGERCICENRTHIFYHFLKRF
jgi:hypothetical protein